jgi:CHAD domain-containing protein
VRGEDLELVVPATLDAAGLIALLCDRLEVTTGRPRTRDRELLDTFDGRLRATGLAAERSVGRGEARAMTLREPGAPVREAQVTASERYLADELPPGPLRDRLAPALGVRALLPLVRVRSRTRSLAVLNRDAKTVVRLELEDAEVVGNGGARLAPRLRVQPVLGYEKAFERTASVLTADLGLAEAEAPLLDQALAASGDGSRAALSTAALGLTRGTRADEAAGQVLMRLADIADQNVPGTLADLDTEFLHDLRVSVRRARSVLREMRGVFPPAERAHLRTELRWVQALTGPVRDLDVQLLEWRELTALLSDERRADVGPLHDLLSRRRTVELRALERGLQSRRFADAMNEWRALAGLGPAPTSAPEWPLAGVAIEAAAGDRIRSVHRRMVRDGSAIDDASPPEALHDLRKRGKELRYLLELFGSLFPQPVVKPMVSALKALQDVLGRFQDCAVQADLLRGLGDELAAKEGGPHALMALGLVAEALLADQQAARAGFAERFGRFAAPEQRALVRDTFPKLGSQ